MGKTHEELKKIQGLRESKYSLALKKAASEIPGHSAQPAPLQAVTAPNAALPVRERVRRWMLPCALGLSVVIIAVMGVMLAARARVAAVKPAVAPSKKTAIVKKPTVSKKQVRVRTTKPAAVKR